jgi:hypothetical protein
MNWKAFEGSIESGPLKIRTEWDPHRQGVFRRTSGHHFQDISVTNDLALWPWGEPRNLANISMKICERTKYFFYENLRMPMTRKGNVVERWDIWDTRTQGVPGNDRNPEPMSSHQRFKLCINTTCAVRKWWTRRTRSSRSGPRKQL